MASSDEQHVDFFVYGVPRSGTTAFVEYLNTHRRVFCATEAFTEREDLDAVRFPSGFAAVVELKSQYDPDLGRNIAEKTGAAERIGNKYPRYYFADLAGLARTRDSILVTRPATGFAASWNSRAGNPDEPGWQAGMGGEIALFEALICAAQTLVSGVDPLVVPYPDLTRDPAGVMDAAYGFLGVAPGEVDPSRFDPIAARSARRRQDGDRPLKPSEQAIYDAASYDRLEAIVLRPGPYRFSDVGADVASYFAALPADFCELFLTTARGEPAVAEYLPQWLHLDGVAPFFDAEAARPGGGALGRLLRELRAQHSTQAFRQRARSLRTAIGLASSRDKRRAAVRATRKDGFDGARKASPTAARRGGV